MLAAQQNSKVVCRAACRTRADWIDDPRDLRSDAAVAEARADRLLERQSVERLVRDMEQDLSDFPGNLERATLGVAAINRLQQAQATRPLSADSVGFYLSQYLQCSVMAANSSEYESLKASGGLNRIRDPEFRQRLTVNYERYAQLADLHEQDCNQMGEVLGHISDEIRTEFRDLRFHVEVVGTVSGVIHDRRFQNALAMHKARRMLIQGFVTGRIRQLEELMAEAALLF